MAGAMRPKWFDGFLQDEMDKGADANAIAKALATNPRLIDAIKRGLANKPKPGPGPTHAQIVSREIQEAMAAD